MLQEKEYFLEEEYSDKLNNIFICVEVGTRQCFDVCTTQCVDVSTRQCVKVNTIHEQIYK